jgi:hypothetical protein
VAEAAANDAEGRRDRQLPRAIAGGSG